MQHQSNKSISCTPARSWFKHHLVHIYIRLLNCLYLIHILVSTVISNEHSMGTCPLWPNHTCQRPSIGVSMLPILLHSVLAHSRALQYFCSQAYTATTDSTQQGQPLMQASDINAAQNDWAVGIGQFIYLTVADGVTRYFSTSVLKFLNYKKRTCSWSCTH